MKLFNAYFLLIIVMSSAMACHDAAENNGKEIVSISAYLPDNITKKSIPKPDNIKIKVTRDITVREYFSFIDSILQVYDTMGGLALNEYHLVMRNPFILDTLRNTDYYFRTEIRNEKLTDTNSLIAINKNKFIIIPNSKEIKIYNKLLANTKIEVNLPEYKLRIWRDDSLLYTFDVRVGKNEHKFLKMAGREISLQTPVGTGEIVRINKSPWFINPVDNKRYYKTRRDDGIYTELPVIPWLEPSINGLRPGSLIHPTTNKSTLGKPASNGCVGLSEGDMWVVYYHAPLGTRVEFKYELNVLTEEGDSLKLEDVYGLRE